MALTRSVEQTHDQQTVQEPAPLVQLPGPANAQNQIGNAAVAQQLGGGRTDISQYTPQYVEAHRDELGIPPGAPIDDFFHEFVAHRLAYQNMSEQDPNRPGISQADADRIRAQQQLLQSWGYQSTVSRDQEIIDPNTGLYAVRFDPTEEGIAAGRSSTVAFRGTQPWNSDEFSWRNPLGPLNDLISDAGPSVGSTQYDANAGAIRDLMAGGTGQVTTTGHSLGGYLAQRAAAENPELARQVVTFQAGGLNRGDVADFEAANQDGHIGVRHHYTTADVVHRAGEQRLPGTFFEHRPNSLTEGHTKYLMYDDNDVTTLAEATGGKTVRQSNQDTVSGWSRHLWEGARTGAGGLGRLGTAPIAGAWDLAAGLWDAGSNAVSGIGDALSNTVGGVGQGLGTAWDGASNGFSQMMDGNILGGLGTMGGGLVSGTGQALMGVGQGALGLGQTAINAVGDTAGAVWDGASTLASNAVTGAGQVLRGGVNLVEGAAEGAWEGAKWAGNKVADAGAAVGSGLKSAWDFATSW